MLVADIMAQGVITITTDHGVRHAAQMMLDHHVSGLPVLDENARLVGMLTEGDLLRRTELGLPLRSQPVRLGSADFIKTHGWRVGDVMTAPVITVEESMSVGHLADLFAKSCIRRVPVMRDAKMIGIVSRADILRGLVAAPRESVASSDEGLQLAVVTRLTSELDIVPGSVKVSVVDANVHLSGQVANAVDRRAVQLAVETLEGVRGVTNVLTILQASSAPQNLVEG